MKTGFEELRQIYNPEGSKLRIIQLELLDILCEIDKICRKHQIRYSLAYGSVLGAIRHKGFIPWDDDLDIQILDSEYYRFLKVMDKELPSHLKLQSHKTDKHYWSVYSKIRNVNSIINEKNSGYLYERYRYKGLYVDVFPLEPSTYKITKISDRLYSHFVINWAKRIKNNKIEFILCSINRFLLLRIAFPFLRIFTKSSKLYTTKLGCYQDAEIMVKEDIIDTIDVPFEGKLFPVPINYDSYLKNIYGDYMKLPKESQRFTHLK